MQHALAEFGSRGGHTGPHVDGWGLGMLRDGDFLLIREPEPSHASAHLRFIREQQLQSPLVVSHIRKATQGSVSLRNTQPFLRELGGKPQLFAHNGDLGPIRLREEFALGGCSPIGESDSEFAFCILLGMLQSLTQREPSACRQQRFDVFCDFASRMATLGAANFLYSDGDCLFAHAHRRRHDDGEIRAPGMFLLCRDLHEHELGSAIASHQTIALLASRPLSDEAWQPIPEHTALLIQHGAVIERRTLPQPQPA